MQRTPTQSTDARGRASALTSNHTERSHSDSSAPRNCTDVQCSSWAARVLGPVIVPRRCSSAAGCPARCPESPARLAHTTAP
jgi:hypothetical protein